MATTEISTPSSQGFDPKDIRRSSFSNPEEVPVVLLELQDKLSRSRVREAFWISVMVHLFAIIAVSTMPHWIPGYKVTLITPSEMFKQHDQTFLALPPDLEKPTVKPKTDVLSDKDRIATTRHPDLNRKELQKILDASRPGRPQPPAQQQMASAAPVAPPMPQQPNQSDQRGNGGQVPQQNQQARLETPNIGAAPRSNNNPFAAAMSAGSAIQQAARATATSRGVGGGGDDGDYGIPQRSNANVQSGLEILSDTQGIDFGPYLERVKYMIQRNWDLVLPEAAFPPISKRGKVTIEFAILPDGRIAGLKLDSPSGDISLDRAAWGGITASNPFPPLPSKYTGQYFALRCTFFYNYRPNEIR